MGRISEDVFGGNSDSETEIKTENDYAKNYDVWRKKEEFNKLKTKYGEVALEGNESSSSSSEDDEDATELTQEVEKDFFKTLSYLKKKDPMIYDSNVTFFKSKAGSSGKEKKVKEQPMYLKDYERKLLLEKGGMLSDEEFEDNARPSTYVKEQQHIKEEIVKLGASIEDDDEDDTKLGGLLEPRKATKEEKQQKEAEYLKWLKGQTEELQDAETKSDLKPLKDFWDDPNLDKNEEFLRDYILNKKYLETGSNDYLPTYDEIIHDSDNSLTGDEMELEKQEEFEHKYNFRFEEPDQEFIKRYPRTIEQSLRRTDNKRQQKRAEIKERKKKEKEEKMMEIKKLQELKRKEIEEKIEKLKQVTGVNDMAFQEDDLEGDFDPEGHDRRMQALFNNEFYEEPEKDQKPQFPDIDEELEIENWDRWEKGDALQYEPHCEDEDFNMDADYNPSTLLKKELVESTLGKKKKRRKSKVAEALNRQKPKFDPNDKNYEKYFDEYYKLECEDFIGDLPCRFKYREVVPNDFGLSVEEILLAKDKELNRWCSLKKTVQRRPDNVEKYEQIAYARKANNITLKKRLLPSLFSTEADDESQVEKPTKDDMSNSLDVAEHESSSVGIESKNTLKDSDTPKNNPLVREEIKKGKMQNQKKEAIKDLESSSVNKKRRKKKKSKNKVDMPNSVQNNEKKVNKKRKRLNSDGNQSGSKKVRIKVSGNIAISDARLSAFGINPKKFKNKLKYGNKLNNKTSVN